MQEFIAPFSDKVFIWWLEWISLYYTYILIGNVERERPGACDKADRRVVVVTL